MEIEKYILDTFDAVDPFSPTALLNNKLHDNEYIAVVDKNKKFYGILTTSDLIRKPHKLVIDCLSHKESLNENDSVFTALEKFNTYQSSALPFFKNDKFIGIVDRKNIQHLLKIQIDSLYDKLVFSKGMKQAFLNNLLHEFRTPLNSIMGFLEIISKLDNNKILNAEEKYCNIVRQNADRFLLVLTDLLELSLLNSDDDINLKITDVNIETVFSDLKKEFDNNNLTSHNKIEINYINPDPTLNMLTDGKKLKHILYHLIDNAIKFSHDNEPVSYGYNIKDETIIFFVKNKGNIIPNEKKDVIFKTFEKEKQYNNKLVDGLGIGLPLVKKLSLLLKGKIEFISEETETIFVCTLPININVLNHELELINS